MAQATAETDEVQDQTESISETKDDSDIRQLIDQVRLLTESKLKGLAVSRGKLYVKRSIQSLYERILGPDLMPETEPEMPPSLAPDHPAYQASYNTIIKAAKSGDIDAAKLLFSIPAVREQAEEEHAARGRASADIPAYLHEHDPIIAIALESLDCGLSDVVRRVEMQLPLSPLEQAIATWIDGRKRGAPSVIRAGTDATAEALEGGGGS